MRKFTKSRKCKRTEVGLEHRIYWQCICVSGNTEAKSQICHMRKAVKHTYSLEPQKLKTAPKWKE